MRYRSQLYPTREPECRNLADKLDVEIEDKPPSSGEFYIAGRNDQPELLVAREISNNAVYPVENAYPYDTGECFRLKDKHQPS